MVLYLDGGEEQQEQMEVAHHDHPIFISSDSTDSESTVSLESELEVDEARSNFSGISMSTMHGKFKDTKWAKKPDEMTDKYMDQKPRWNEQHTKLKKKEGCF